MHPPRLSVFTRLQRSALIAALLLATACSAQLATEVSTVTRVIDGDTIEVETAGTTERVRLIGIDTPESVDPEEPVRCFARDASGFTEQSLEGKTVELEYDVERLDRYGRTLAYVYLDGQMFNLTLVRRGFARAYPYPPNTRYEDQIAAAEDAAHSEGLGLWGACEPTPAQERHQGKGSGSCAPSYPDLCIPPPPPDLDCGDLNQTGFRVRGSDPHVFDGDGNRVGCETG